MGNQIELTASDDHRFAAYVAEPKDAAHGAIVIAPEIFGINAHIRAVADDYAAEGFLAIAPALFDRVQRGFETGYEPEDIKAGIELMNRIDIADAIRDTEAAVEYASSAGRVGLVGYCWGGVIAWVGAARIDSLSASVAYYGGGIPNYADEAPRCPLLCHFGELDTSPTPEQARDAVGRHAGIETHFYAGAGHGFNCDMRASYNAEAAKLARERSLAFFRKHIG
ncbi:MAG: dienelactone hydrolase family protein [Burkholderiaceae bacterium]